jgi:hypothetical protein
MSEELVSSRRQLLVGGAVLAAALPGASVSAFAKPLAMRDFGDWQAQVGKDFTVNGTPMRLVAVKGGLRQPNGLARKHNFTTVFEVDGAVPEAGLHKVAHADLGQATLYMEPSISDQGKPRLRASFS